MSNIAIALASAALLLTGCAFINPAQSDRLSRMATGDVAAGRPSRAQDEFQAEADYKRYRQYYIEADMARLAASDVADGRPKRTPSELPLLGLDEDERYAVSRRYDFEYDLAVFRQEQRLAAGGPPDD